MSQPKSTGERRIVMASQSIIILTLEVAGNHPFGNFAGLYPGIGVSLSKVLCSRATRVRFIMREDF